MKILIALLFFSSVAFAKPHRLPVDPRISIAKNVAAKLYRDDVSSRYPVEKVTILEQDNTFFLVQVATKNKKNYCFIFEVNIIDDNVPEVTMLVNDNDVEGIFVTECSTHPITDELSHFKIANGWPVHN